MRQLHNRYFGMRHGKSLANVQKIIVSYPENGVLSKYGLSEVGRRQVEASVNSAELPADTYIYSSDFSRAYQTAEIVRSAIGAAEITPTKLLRERYFGDWEKTSHENYKKVWQIDKMSADASEHNVESLNQVWARVWELIQTIEQLHHDSDILLVSHGDTLQILQTGLSGAPLTEHRNLAYIKTAEIRRLV